MTAPAQPLRVALIGPGAIAKVWAKAIAKTPSIQLVEVAGLRRSDADGIAREFEGCERSANWKATASRPDIDAVLVMTPHALLAPMSEFALNAGKHVLCEKPAGVNAAQVKKNTALATRKKRVYMVGFNHRYHAAYIEAKKLIDDGAIGKLLSVRGRYGFGGRPGYNREWRFKPQISGGGHLMDQGIHLIDLSRHFLGDFSAVRSFAENLYWGGAVEDNAFLLLRTKSRQVAQLHASLTNWEWVHSYEIFGTKGYLAVDGLDTRYRGPERLTVGSFNPKKKDFPVEKVIPFPDERKEDSFARELDIFAAAVQGKKAAYPTGHDAVAALQIIERVYRENKRPVQK